MTGSLPGFLRSLVPFVRPETPSLLAASALQMLGAGANLVLLWQARRLVDVIASEKNLAALPGVMAVVGALYILQAGFGVGHAYLVVRFGQRVGARLKVRLFERLEAQPFDYFSRHKTGELVSRLSNDVGALQSFLETVPSELARHAVTFSGATALLIYLNARLSLWVLAVVPAVVVAAKWSGRRMRRLSRDYHDRSAEALSTAEEALSSIRAVRSFQREEFEAERFGTQVWEGVRFALRRAAVNAILAPGLTLLGVMGAAGMVWYGGVQVIEGGMSAGDLVAFALYGGLLMGPFITATSLVGRLKEAQGASERVLSLLETPGDPTKPTEARALPRLRGRIRVREVEFSYPDGPPVLRGVSLDIPAGSVAAVVGPTGGGKSTLIQLIHGFYEPSAGSIEMDGEDIRTVRKESLYRQIAWVPQETILFGGTVSENLCYGKLDATEKEIEDACRIACVTEFIRALPRGLDTVIGQRGVMLSGGERQRIAIARAVLKDPRVLLLDEATSALDSETDRRVQDAIAEWGRGRTVLAVAHRLSTIRHADIILAMDAGRIIEQGTHDDLLARGGLYHHLWMLHVRAEERQTRPIALARSSA
ncbi:MAG: ABC transporter ATP-binding protein [Nitrospirae bacterium]|nr:ABC transporter ATP-binding protein [Nitrospirota bacterium]